MNAMPKYAARRDENEEALVKTARQLGWWMLMLTTPCDWLGWHPKRGWQPVEIKSEKGQYTKDQQTFIASAAFYGAPVITWRNIDDVIRDSQ